MILTRDGKEISAIYKQDGSEVEEVKDATGRIIYSASREITGTSPLYFSGKGKPLTDYRIYGETMQDGTPSVDIVGCGVRTENLFNKSTWHGVTVTRGNVEEVENGFRITASSDNAYTNTYGSGVPQCSYKVLSGGTYTLSWEVDDPYVYGAVYVFSGNTAGNDSLTNIAAAQRKVSFTVPSGHNFIAFRLGVSSSGGSIAYTNIALNVGSTSIPYEPYGYKIPVTIGNTTTPIYIGSDPLYRIGDYADEVDFGNQRIIRRVNPTTMQPYETPITSTVTIPQLAVAFGDNTLTVDTAVKPSQMYIKGKIKPTGYGQLLDVNDVDIKDNNGTPIFIQG